MSSSSSYVSPTILRFQLLSKPSASIITQKNGNQPRPSLVTLGWANTRLFPTLKSTRLQVNCARAKPETVAKVSDIVKKQLSLSPETSVTSETTFANLGADSLDTVEIVMALEQEFGISVEQDSSENITTIQDAADIIETLIEKDGSSSK